ncbi:TetR/AcrR family transcriptional regulator [Nocardia bovistercoris]|uniref:TetR/AcrR family transcriptional regulator n=1 Tax=Nocardia bovistercoris TaxID=2785916 RepID=A0A931N756_9NOCA|nr:TetR/AcrR family transcriptional regulator [Nocardia bovistercoris]MBH0781432.1 TetR/AcrR family transcriptional regulator [Nocardia bovistercoris]
MRTRGWLGHPPATDDEARQRILESAHRSILDRGGRTTIAHVATDLGLSRATVYRYYPSTAALLQAAAAEGTKDFMQQLGDKLHGYDDLAEAAVEGVAFIVARVPTDPYLQLLYDEPSHTLLRTVTSDTTRTIARALLLERTAVDWTQTPLSMTMLDELVEWIQRVVQSFLSDPGTPERTNDELRAYLQRWLAPSIHKWVRTPALTDSEPT